MMQEKFKELKKEMNDLNYGNLVLEENETYSLYLNGRILAKELFSIEMELVLDTMKNFIDIQLIYRNAEKECNELINKIEKKVDSMIEETI